MSIDLECPACWKDLHFNDDQAGAEARCPHCFAVFTLPGAEPASYGLANPVLCPDCGRDLPRDAVLCTNCGHDFRTGQKRKHRVEEKEFRHSAENSCFTIRRDDRGRWYIESIGKVLKLLRIKPSIYELKNYRSAQIVHSYDDDLDEFTLNLIKHNGEADPVYYGFSRPLIEWFEEILRDEVGMRVDIG